MGPFGVSLKKRRIHAKIGRWLYRAKGATKARSTSGISPMRSLHVLSHHSSYQQCGAFKIVKAGAT